MASNAKFCAACAAPLEIKVPEGDNREREVCTKCETIFYSNPKIVAGAILESEGKLLLCRRAIEPRSNYWTVPAGFMENRESVMEAAAREAKEEACAQAETLYFQGMYNLKYNNQVYMMYRGSLRNGECAAGHETSEVLLCDADNIPWDEMAFDVIEYALKLYLEDRERLEFPVHEADLFRDESGRVKFARYT